MAFVILVAVVLWTVIWPVILYYYFQEQSYNVPSRTQVVAPKDVRFTTAIIEDDVYVKMIIGNQEYLISDDHGAIIKKNLDSSILKVRTINEVGKLN